MELELELELELEEILNDVKGLDSVVGGVGVGIGLLGFILVKIWVEAKVWGFVEFFEVFAVWEFMIEFVVILVFIDNYFNFVIDDLFLSLLSLLYLLSLIFLLLY